MVIKMNGTSIAVYRMCLGALLCMTNPHVPRLSVLTSWLLVDALVEDWFVEAEHALAAHLH